MEQQQWICPGCSRKIEPEETFIVGDGCLSHLNCQRPRVLGPEERAVLFRYCWNHPAAKCEQCAKTYRITELAADLFSDKELRCSL